MKKKNLIIILFLTQTLSVFAQSNPARQAKPIALINGTVHVGNGQVIEKGIVTFDNGKITGVGTIVNTPYDAGKFQVIDVQGKQVYPGLIAPNSLLGLKEIDLDRSTIDAYETGDFNSNVRSIVAYNADSKVIPTIRTNGILIVEVTPFGGIIQGSSSIVELDGWNWEDAAYKMDNNLHMRWPGVYSYNYATGAVSVSKDYAKQVDAIKSFFSEAKAYCTEADHETKNLRFEAMRGIFDGSKKMFITADRAKEIIGAVDLAKNLGIKIAIVGGNESYLVATLLKDNNIPVIIDRVHALPANEGDDVDLPYKLPYLLQQAGILTGISLSNGGDNYWNGRNLPFEAGTAVAYGLTKEEALTDITLNNAKILGIDQTLGSLQVGKDATIVVSEGDILDMRTSKVFIEFIRGKQIDVRNWQNDNYEKYSKKYGIEVK